MLPFNYHHLYYFYSIAKHGSVTKAAQALKLSQSSLSMQLGQFETFIEKQLFRREGKKLFITEEGEQILEYAKAIFDLGDELSKEITTGFSAQRTISVRMGSSGFVPKSFTDAMLNYVLAESPEVYVSLVEKGMNEMMRDLEVHALDMLLTDKPYDGPPDHGIETHLLARIPIKICANHRLAKGIKKFQRI